MPNCRVLFHLPRILLTFFEFLGFRADIIFSNISSALFFPCLSDIPVLEEIFVGAPISWVLGCVPHPFSVLYISVEMSSSSEILFSDVLHFFVCCIY